MNVDVALVAYLREQSDLIDVVVDRIRCGRSAPKSAALPDIYFERVGGDRAATLDGSDKDLAKSYLVEFVVRSTERSQMLGLMEDLLLSLDALHGATVDVGAEEAVFETAIVESEPADLDPEPLTDGGTSGAVERRSVLVSLLF